MSFIARMFTPSKSDSQSGAQYNLAYNAAQRASAPPAVAPAPTPEKAQNAARIAAEKQKRIRALAGGKTLLSQESPILTPGGSTAKTLLGS